MKSDEPISPQKPKLVKVADPAPDQNKGEAPPEVTPAEVKDQPLPQPDSAPGSPHDADSSALRLVDEEMLRARIRQWMGEQPPPSARQRFYSSPLAPVALTFILSGLLGSFLTYYLTSKQKELELQRAEEQRKLERLYEDQRRESERLYEERRRESDVALEERRRESDRIYQEHQKQSEHLQALEQKRLELLYDRHQKELNDYRDMQRQYVEHALNSSDEQNNRMRIPKIGEVWGEIFKTEAEIDGLIEKMREGTGGGAPKRMKDEDVKKILGLIREQKLTIDKNRFFYGNDNYKQVEDYLKISGEYAAHKLLGWPEKYLTEERQRRDRAKPDILELRKRMSLEKAPTPAAPSTQPP